MEDSRKSKNGYYRICKKCGELFHGKCKRGTICISCFKGKISDIKKIYFDEEITRYFSTIMKKNSDDKLISDDNLNISRVK